MNISESETETDIILEVTHISKSFNINSDLKNLPVIHDISFNVRRGECFVIIGPNGSGKTTLLRLLGLLETPSAGGISYEGAEITQLSPRKKVDIRRKMAYVRQKPVVLNASVYDNVAAGLQVREYEDAEIETRVSQIIQRIGLKGFEKENARKLSGGEMQRVAIAMNFVISPEILLLDEISANLDPQNNTLLEEFIYELKRDKTKTIIMSTHDPMEAIKFADRIAVLNEGKFSQVDTPERVFTTPKDEFTAQFVGYENIFRGIAKIDQISKINHIKINDLTIATVCSKEGEVKACIRPQSIMIAKDRPHKSSFRNILPGKITSLQNLGNIIHVMVSCHSEVFLVTITKEACQTLQLEQGSAVFISFKATDITCL
jgi:molybdopterin-binding protein